MHHCQRRLTLTMTEYEALPEKDGTIPYHALSAYECGRPAGNKHHGVWLCSDHYDAISRVGV